MSTVSTERPDDTNAPAGAPVIELRGITKRFPGVVANSDVNLTVGRGEVHAVVGENGAGKSTLMKTLYGMHQPDEGTILLEGRPVVFKTPTAAIAAGIGMVHQHFMLADNFTVLENIILGSEPERGGRIDFEAARAKVQQISDSYGLGLRPDRLVEDLSVADQQRVEIAKVLYRGARVLILDEPTAVLVPQEVDELFANLAGLRAEGLSVIFISHKLDEVLKVADRITVIRRGTTVGTADPKAVTARQLAEMMVGSELPVPETRESTVTDHVQLGVRGVSAVGSEGTTVLDDVSFEVHRGEVVGFAGVEGNGQSELVEMLLGLVHPTAGSVTLDGEDITAWSTERRREHGIAFVPEDRHRQALMLSAPLWENRVLGHQWSHALFRRAFLRRRFARDDTARIMREYDVRAPGPDTLAVALSGGNQQKLIIGRELESGPSVLVAAHPTRGVDVGAQAAIWDRIRDARSEGLATLLISADLEELIGLSDTLYVILRGPSGRQAGPGHRHARGPRVLHDRRRRPRRRRTGRGPATGTWPPPEGNPGMNRLRRGVVTGLVPAVVALLVSLVVLAIVLALLGVDPVKSLKALFDFGPTPRAESNQVRTWINQSVPLFLSGLAVSVGFRMNLFNIGVEGQYSVAAVVAAAAGAMVHLPQVLHIAFILLVAMAAGAAYASVPAVLKVKRGVNEVITTIMLNSIAVGLIAYLLRGPLHDPALAKNASPSTRPLPESAWFPGFRSVFETFGLQPPSREVGGFIFVAIVVGVIVSVVMNRTRFGFALRASGRNSTAAAASGIPAGRMTMQAMLLSGALAGLVGMPQVLGEDHAYGINFVAGLGFSGIAVALLGRNSPGGIAAAALLFAFLDRAGPSLQRVDIPPSVVVITQGVIVLSVVIVNEVARRMLERSEERRVGGARSATPPAAPQPAEVPA